MKKTDSKTRARSSRRSAPPCSVSLRETEKALAAWAISHFPNLCGLDRKPNTPLCGEEGKGEK